LFGRPLLASSDTSSMCEKWFDGPGGGHQRHSLPPGHSHTPILQFPLPSRPCSQNFCWKLCLHLRGPYLQIRANRFNNRKRMLEVVIVVTITVASIFTLAYTLGSCVDVPEWREKGYGFTLYCTDGPPPPPHTHTPSQCTRTSKATFMRCRQPRLICLCH